MSTEVLTEYAALVAKRKTCVRCVADVAGKHGVIFGLQNPAQLFDGKQDSTEIGPWTRWQGALDAELMVVGQDWGDVDYLETHNGLDDPDNSTNVALRHLLAIAGFSVEPVGPTTERGTIFLTNAILCLKRGGMGARVRAAWFNECGEHFLRPQVDLIRPSALVTLGERAYRAVCRAFGRPSGAFRKAVEAESPPEIREKVRFFPRYHCSPRVLARARVIAQQREDWRRIGDALGRSPVPLLP